MTDICVTNEHTKRKPNPINACNKYYGGTSPPILTSFLQKCGVSRTTALMWNLKQKPKGCLRCCHSQKTNSRAQNNVKRPHPHLSPGRLTCPSSALARAATASSRPATCRSARLKGAAPDTPRPLPARPSRPRAPRPPPSAPPGDAIAPAPPAPRPGPRSQVPGPRSLASGPRPPVPQRQSADPETASAAKMTTNAPAGPSAAAGSSRRLQQTQNQVDEVVDIMRVNVDKVLERDQKLSELDDRADALQAGASQFETSAAKLKRKYWWKNCKMWAIGITVVVIIIIIIVVWSISS
uniref:V-SNARE coiled-coil homology domain-containing protein n=2 Tax=Capra hircus TaxID=9925 RepID=A0A8C2XYD8_CAPHI